MPTLNQDFVWLVSHNVKFICQISLQTQNNESAQLSAYQFLKLLAEVLFESYSETSFQVYQSSVFGETAECTFADYIRTHFGLINLMLDCMLDFGLS
jgi:hypothetical protein